jgi:parallel beta-helix repeat protein
MNKNAFDKIATSILLGTILSALLLAFPPTSNAAQPINGCTQINTPGSYRLVADLISERDCVTITVSDVDLRLNGHTITGPGTNTFGSGISIGAHTNVKVKGPGIITNFSSGVSLHGTDSSELTDVTVTNNFAGFFVVEIAEGNLFRRNTATGNVGRGFFLEGASNNSFLNNVASNNEDGFIVGPGTGNHFKGNTMNGNSSSGITAIGTSEEPSTAHTIEDNTADGNQFGIHLWGFSTGNNVSGNTTVNGFVGIALQGSSGNNININTTLNNRFGIALQGSSGNNISANTALNNSLTDLTDESVECDNNLWTNNIFNTANQPCIQ